MERLAREVHYSQEIVARFAKLDAARMATKAALGRVADAERALHDGKAISDAERRHQQQFNEELARWLQAGVLRRLFMRAEEAIRRDIRNQESRIQSAKDAIGPLEERLKSARAESDAVAKTAEGLEVTLGSESREEHQKILADYDAKQTPLRGELSEITAQNGKHSKLRVNERPGIVGATVTRTFLRPVEFASFDVVIVDEASMILLPAVFHALGLATEKVVIAGDFQQLPPIIQTEQKAIHDILGHDVFTEAGISHETVNDAARLVMLDEQFRMHESICQIVSNAFYGGKLRTSPKKDPESFAPLHPFEKRLVIIDTSRVWPFTTRDIFESRLNLMHALAIRNLVLHFRERGQLFDGNAKCRIGRLHTIRGASQASAGHVQGTRAGPGDLASEHRPWIPGRRTRVDYLRFSGQRRREERWNLPPGEYAR